MIRTNIKKRILFLFLGIIAVAFLLSHGAFRKANSFAHAFQTSERVSESGSIEGGNAVWWVDSGGYMDISSGEGFTIQGDLPEISPWRVRYSESNPVDTDGGVHPQNIFRLILKSMWNDFAEEAYFKIHKDNLSSSPNRNESNGIVLFGRYRDADNLYYVGLRVDGQAVIKKKKNGMYSVLAEMPVIADTLPYDRNTNPDVLPKNTWIGLKTEISTEKNDEVRIKLWTDIGKTGKWKLVAEVVDKNDIINGPAYVGIRTDFMDVSFTDFKITEKQ